MTWLGYVGRYPEANERVKIVFSYISAFRYLAGDWSLQWYAFQDFYRILQGSFDKMMAYPYVFLPALIMSHLSLTKWGDLSLLLGTCSGLPPFLKAEDMASGHAGYNLCFSWAFGKSLLPSAFTPETCPCAYCMLGKRFSLFWSAGRWRSFAKHCVVRKGTKPNILQTPKDRQPGDGKPGMWKSCLQFRETATGWQEQLMQAVKKMYSYLKDTKSGYQKDVQLMRMMSHCGCWFLTREHPITLRCCGSRMQLYSLGWLAGFCAVLIGLAV